MSTSKDPERKPSTFDDIIHTKPLLFRLHSPKFSHTFFDDDSKILFASRNEKIRSEDIFPTLKALKEKPTPYEEDAAARHITSWNKRNTDPSDFISLTYNFWYVLWEWKRRRRTWQPPQGQSEVSRPEDDFQVIVFETSGLKGRARLGTEAVLLTERKEGPEGYRFAQAHAEVIVPDFIQPPTTLGTMSLSQLQGFIPPWCRDLLVSGEQDSESEMNKTPGFKDFTQRLGELKSSTNEDDRVLQSLRFALELLAPILASGEHWHQRADNESAVGSANRDSPRNDGRALDWSNHDSTSEACSPRAARPHKRRKLAEAEEEQRKVQDIPEPVYAEQGGEDPERLRACKYIRAILADIWYMERMGEPQALQETCTDDVDKLLKRYMETIEKYVLHPCRRFHS